MWLGSDISGDAVVFQSVGYSARAVTTFALSTIFNSFTTITDAIGFSHQWDQHIFYVLTFPSQGVTYCYDSTTGKWHQRGYFVNGQFQRERANCYTNFLGRIVVGDYQNGNIYQLSDDSYTDNGNPRKWLRSWNALPGDQDTEKEILFRNLQIFMETGVTVPYASNRLELVEGGNVELVGGGNVLLSGPPPQIEPAPQIMLRWSDDAGYTWSNYHLMSAGFIGQTAWRVTHKRLGQTRYKTGTQRVFEISGLAPVRTSISGATVEMMAA
jgi:hypothetical protein